MVAARVHRFIKLCTNHSGSWTQRTRKTSRWSAARSYSGTMLVEQTLLSWLYGGRQCMITNQHGAAHLIQLWANHDRDRNGCIIRKTSQVRNGGKRMESDTLQCCSIEGAEGEGGGDTLTLYCTFVLAVAIGTLHSSISMASSSWVTFSSNIAPLRPPHNAKLYTAPSTSFPGSLSKLCQAIYIYISLWYW